jgi:uncharacterized protein YdeI (YjbR/CyaY-like superfamily)
MKELEYIHFGKREKFREWLLNNHELSPGIWVIFYKKNLNKDCIKYTELLEEVLCFGWIDSLIKKIESYLHTGKVDWAYKTTQKKGIGNTEVPDFIISHLAKNEPALTNFNNLAYTYKRHYVLWITGAKRKETIQNRLKESIELLKENKKLGLK